METNIVYGIHAVGKMLTFHSNRIKRASVSKSADSARIKKILEQLAQIDVEVRYFAKEKITELAKSPQHQGIVLEIEALTVQSENDLIDLMEKSAPGYFVALDTVEDPRNLGACIRTAESLGALGVIIPKDKSANVTPVVRKVACGAAEILPIYQVTNLSRTLKTMQEYGYWVYGTGWSDKSQCLYKTEFPTKFAVVMGSEGTGLRQLTAKTCDQLITIPMPGISESLNVSVATGIVCAEIVRQNQSKNS
jgi:23S rRNA (guanosine2251-2'-O)-methyltransferase